MATGSQASITAGSAVLSGVSFNGVARVHTTAGTVAMLKFSMDSLTLSGGSVLTVSEAGRLVVVKDGSLHFRGHVVLLTTRFSGDLIGIPVTFTPQHPPPLVLPVMTLTHVVTDQPVTTADSLRAEGLRISAK